MSPKEFLQQYRVCCRKYQGVLESIEQTRSMAEKTTQVLSGDNICSGTSDKVGSIGAILADMETQAFEQMRELAEKKRAVTQAIERVPQENQRIVLYHRYILQKKWENIAVDLSLDLRWVYRLHGEGLQNIRH